MKFKRFLTVICICSLCICLSANVKARADAFPSASEILALRPGVELTGIANAYESLTAEQKLIACYIIGAYNNAYLCARGFSYNIPATENSLKAQFLALGKLVFEYATTEYGWRSRFNDMLRQYLSSAIVYASEKTGTFEAWYTSIKQSGTGLYIPYSEEAFDAWTAWYNDPSGDGIANFGEVVTAWDLGNQYDFAFRNLPFDDSYDQNQYNNFVFNNSPVIYTNSGVSVSDDRRTFQYCLGLNNFTPYDSLFFVRNNYQTCRYGYSDFTYLNSGSVPMLSYYFINTRNTVNYQGIYQASLRGSFTLNVNSNSLLDYINAAIALTPFYYNGFAMSVSNYYPFVEHIYIVDDINTLANPEEIYNTSNMNITAPAPGKDKYIITPNGKFLLPVYTPLGTDNLNDLWDNIVNNSYDIDNQELTSEDDYHTQIVNNTTINNYYVTDSDKINVPVEWFKNELTDQLAQDSIPFLQFARDCIDCLGDLQIYLYGAVVFGLAGGVLKKFLL